MPGLKRAALKQLLMWKEIEAAFVARNLKDPAPPSYKRADVVTAAWETPAISAGAAAAAQASDGLANGRGRRTAAGEHTPPRQSPARVASTFTPGLRAALLVARVSFADVCRPLRRAPAWMR